MSENKQDNTFIRQDYEPIKDMVKRNQKHQERLNAERKEERDNFEPQAAPTYEPIKDTKESLNRMAQPDVFARGKLRKSDPHPRVPYKRDNNK